MTVVTGITGKSGRWMLRAIQEDSDTRVAESLRFLVRSQAKAQLLRDHGLGDSVILGDTADSHALGTVFRGAETVFHIAGIHTSIEVVKACVAARVRRIILVHTTGIYSRYKSASRLYLAIEETIGTLLQGTGIALTILRPTMIYGSLADKNIGIFIRLVDRFRIFPVVNGARYALQPIHEKDLGEAYVSVLKNPDITDNRNYTLSGKEPIELIAILRTIGAQLGKRTWFVSVPFWLAFGLAWFIYLGTLSRVDYREKVQRLIEPRVFDHTPASRDLGFEPVSFEVGVSSEIVEYKENKRTIKEKRSGSSS